jgi:hypothetical protein
MTLEAGALETNINSIKTKQNLSLNFMVDSLGRGVHAYLRTAHVRNTSVYFLHDEKPEPENLEEPYLLEASCRLEKPRTYKIHGT